MKSSHTIQFLLNDTPVEIDFRENKFKPSTTVLTFLRHYAGLKGVKEGCAEGDCGACTVVVAQPGMRGDLEYKCVNSCLLFLPMIHGKQLITAEHLAEQKNGAEVLHPVQQALVDHHGSQCGYCTPGFVMAMFALYKNHSYPSRETVEEALTGNLCRCTGYRPIVDAAVEACKNGGNDHFLRNHDTIFNQLKEISDDHTTLELSAKNQLYLKPFTLNETLRLRTTHPAAMITGGSTDAALLQTKKRIHLPEILDISAVNELNMIVEDHNKIAIGAGTTLQELLDYSRERLKVLAKMLDVFGSLQIRNLATIGGNIGSASPIGDTLPVLMALEAKVNLISTKGQREMLIEEFIRGYRQTALMPDELIAFILIDKPGKNELLKSYKISKRKDLDISSVSAAFRLRLSSEGMIRKAILAYGGMAAMPARARQAEEFLEGKTWAREHAEAAAEIIAAEFSPISDARAEAASRKIMAKNLLLKFFAETSITRLQREGI